MNPFARRRAHDARTAWYGVHASLRYATRSTASGGGALGVAIGDGKARAPDVSSDFFRFGR